MPDLKLSHLRTLRALFLVAVLNIAWTPLETRHRSKDDLHLFQAFALRLLEQEPAIEDNRVVEDRKHEEGPPTNVSDGVRCDLAEDKIEEPLRGCTCGDADFSDPVREDCNRVSSLVAIVQ